MKYLYSILLVCGLLLMLYGVGKLATAANEAKGQIVTSEHDTVKVSPNALSMTESTIVSGAGLLLVVVGVGGVFWERKRQRVGRRR